LWWRQLTGIDQTLDKTHLMRLAGRFSRRLRGYARAHQIPVVDCRSGEDKHQIAEEYLEKTKIRRGVFLILAFWWGVPRPLGGMSIPITT